MTLVYTLQRARSKGNFVAHNKVAHWHTGTAITWHMTPFLSDTKCSGCDIEWQCLHYLKGGTDCGGVGRHWVGRHNRTARTGLPAPPAPYSSPVNLRLPSRRLGLGSVTLLNVFVPIVKCICLICQSYLLLVPPTPGSSLPLASEPELPFSTRTVIRTIFEPPQHLFEFFLCIMDFNFT